MQAGHVRRFFFIDTLLATSAADPGAASGSRAVVFPSSMSLVVTIRPDARNRIYPPCLTIGCVQAVLRCVSGVLRVPHAGLLDPHLHQCRMHAFCWLLLA